MWLVIVVVRRYIIVILLLLSPTPLVLALFLAASSLFLCSFLNVFSFLGFKRAGCESACGVLAFAWRRACLVVRVRDANG